MATFSIGQWHGWLGKGLTTHQLGHLIYLIVELPCWRTQVSSYPWPIWRDLFTNFFQSFFRSWPFQVPDYPASPLATGHEEVNSHTSVQFFFQTECNTRVLPKVLPTRKISLWWCVSGLTQKGVIMLLLSTSACRTISKSRYILSLLAIHFHGHPCHSLEIHSNTHS